MRLAISTSKIRREAEFDFVYKNIERKPIFKVLELRQSPNSLSNKKNTRQPPLQNTS